MNSWVYRCWVPLTVGSIGILLIAVGVFFISHKVMDTSPDDSGDPFHLFQRIGEPQMVIDATFSGVARSPKGILYSTYDRSASRGRKACPT